MKKFKRDECSRIISSIFLQLNIPFKLEIEYPDKRRRKMKRQAGLASPRTMTFTIDAPWLPLSQNQILWLFFSSTGMLTWGHP